MNPLAPLIDTLHADGRLRVWSLVITVFGDAIQHRGGRISTAELLRLFACMQIEAGTLRTALSRLTADGWIEREREGRNSFYRLSTKGRTVTEEASPAIYLAPQPEPDCWSLQLGGTPPQGISLAEGVWLMPGMAETGVAVTGQIGAGVAQLRATVLTPSHRAQLDIIHQDIAHADAANLDGLQTLAARCLLIHRWRRIVLRFPEIPAVLLPDGLADPRLVLARVYPRLFHASKTSLDLPPQTAPILRFGQTLPP